MKLIHYPWYTIYFYWNNLFWDHFLGGAGLFWLLVLAPGASGLPVLCFFWCAEALGWEGVHSLTFEASSLEVTESGVPVFWSGRMCVDCDHIVLPPFFVGPHQWPWGWGWVCPWDGWPFLKRSLGVLSIWCSQPAAWFSVVGLQQLRLNNYSYSKWQKHTLHTLTNNNTHHLYMYRYIDPGKLRDILFLQYHIYEWWLCRLKILLCLV